MATLYGYGVGVYSFLLRCFHYDNDWTALRAGARWFVHYYLRNVIRSLLHRPQAVPLRYTASEIKGVFAAYGAYRKTRRTEREWGRGYAPERDRA